MENRKNDKYYLDNIINGLRNKIVHDYGAIKLDIIYQTIKNDLPNLLKYIENISN